MKREPVLVLLGGLASVVSLGLVAAKLLGWIDLTPEALAAVVAFIGGACGLAAAVLRAAVDSPATVEAKVAKALETPPPGWQGGTP